jgi:hypothetical protein
MTNGKWPNGKLWEMRNDHDGQGLGQVAVGAEQMGLRPHRHLLYNCRTSVSYYVATAAFPRLASV